MAVFVSNPRKYAENGAQDRTIAKHFGVSLGAIKLMKKTNYKLYTQKLAEAGGKSAVSAHRAKGKVVRSKAKSYVASRVAAKKGRGPSKRKAGSRKSVRSARTASARSSKFTGVKKGAKGRAMHFINGKLVSASTYATRTGAPGGHRGKGAYMAPAMHPSMVAKRARAASRKGRKGKGRKSSGRKSAGKVAASTAMKLFRSGQAPSLKAAWAMAKGQKKNPSGYIFNRGHKGHKKLRNRNNPSAMGFLTDAKNFILGELTIANGLAALGAAATLFYATPYIEEQASRIPVIGEYTGYVPYTLTGLSAGAVIAAGGYAIGQGQVGLAIAAAAAGGGLLIDILALFNDKLTHPASDKSGIAYNGIAYSGVVVQNPGYGGVVVQNPGYGAAEESAMLAEYSDASDGDAWQSGEDFDEDEGQCFMDGPAAFFSRFGRPPRVASRQRGPYSRHAGRKGHRWGWLVKLVGPKMVAEIAALPADRRVAVIAELRKQAVASLQSIMAQQQQLSTSNLPDGGYNISHEGAASGQAGANAYGAIVYAGAGY